MKNLIFLLFIFGSINTLQAQSRPTLIYFPKKAEQLCFFPADSLIDIRYRNQHNRMELLKGVVYLGKDTSSILIKPYPNMLNPSSISIPFKDVRMIYGATKKRFTGKGAALGTLTGGILGFLVGNSRRSPSCRNSGNSSSGGLAGLQGLSCLDEDFELLGFMLGGMALGGTIGFMLNINTVKKVEIKDLP